MGDAVDVVAVVGACGPERRRYAQRLAQVTNKTFFPASRLSGSADPGQQAVALASWSDSTAGVVVELPEEVVTTELIGAFAAPEERARLTGLVCVVDATHVLDDLHRDGYVPLRHTDSETTAPVTARALLTVTQIEYASAIVFVGWEMLGPVELATIMALVSHLSPFARLRLNRQAMEPVHAAGRYTSEQSRPGWASVLNGNFAPHMIDGRVSAFRYEQVRPLHPGRLMAVLDRIEDGEFGVLVRSAGFCRLATRPHITAQWDHVGQMFSLNPLAADDRLADGEELLAVGQDLAFIGLRVDADRLTAALDGAALTDEELTTGPTAWMGFADPFPDWQIATDRAD
ncbi:GTP-binding protein [Microbacterium sp.]|uniref:GTP-binding protein n=1 Tax=Microbacterium sp. TaxID=51671 RepID=UPI0039E61B6E